MTAPLVLHSSRIRLGLSLLTPVVLGFIGWNALGAGRIVPVLLLLAAIGTAAVTLLDLPHRTEFTVDGFTRFCLLRRHTVPWGEVVAIERTMARPRRRRPAGEVEAPDAHLYAGPRRSQGLTARTGPRRVTLLVDRRESAAEWAVLDEWLRDRATQLRAARPPMAAVPAGRGPRALHNRQG